MTNPEHVLERYVADLQRFGTSTDKEEIVLYAAGRIKDLEQELESVKDLVKRQNAGWGEDKAELHYLREALDLIINMDNQMFTLEYACSVALDAVAKARKGQDNE